MVKVKVLVQGTHYLSADKKINLYSTTTLIRSNINIIVDPGSFINNDKLVNSLKEEGLEAGDIDAVVLTHLHLDHTANAFLFPNAKIYCKFISGNYPGQYQVIGLGYAERFNLLKEPIAEEVQIIETTGHSIDHVSLVVQSDLGKIVVAGDAIAGEEWADDKKLPDKNLVYSIRQYKKSRKKILKIADYVIPGHGGIFKVNK